MLKGKFLGPGDAKYQYDEFWRSVGGAKLPYAVCYKLTELASFYFAANAMFSRLNVEEEQRGVALMLGTHLDQDSSHAKNKPTIMMVATQFRDNVDPRSGKVDAINNPVIKGGWPTGVIPPNIDDLAYDAGSLWP
jgi:hypothetical protein